MAKRSPDNVTDVDHCTDCSLVNSVLVEDLSNNPLPALPKPWVITQYVADKVDHDIRTLNNLDIFHGMEIIRASVHVDDGSKGVPEIDLQVIKRIPSHLLSVDIAKDVGVP